MATLEQNRNDIGRLTNEKILIIYGFIQNFKKKVKKYRFQPPKMANLSLLQDYTNYENYKPAQCRHSRVCDTDSVPSLLSHNIDNRIM